ncbi:MAG: NifB/NifX family molybdenum-iron cluster-binding protein [Bacteroidota bacterium]
MLTAITSKNDHIDSEFDLRFGRGAWFCIFNEKTGDIQFIENEHKDAQGGAGTKAAEKMISLGVKKIISGDFGPKAKELLDKFNIQLVILQDEANTIEQIIGRLQK